MDNELKKKNFLMKKLKIGAVKRGMGRIENGLQNRKERPIFDLEPTWFVWMTL